MTRGQCKSSTSSLPIFYGKSHPQLAFARRLPEHAWERSNRVIDQIAIKVSQRCARGGSIDALTSHHLILFPSLYVKSCYTGLKVVLHRYQPDTFLSASVHNSKLSTAISTFVISSIILVNIAIQQIRETTI